MADISLTDLDLLIASNIPQSRHTSVALFLREIRINCSSVVMGDIFIRQRNVHFV